MENINTFISNKLKEQKISFEDFLESTNISKATYYRYVKIGPDAFKIKHVKRIAELLSLTYQECMLYFKKAPENLEKESLQCNEIIKEIFSYSSPLNGTITNTEFEYFDEATNGNVINKFTLDMLSSFDTAKRIYSSFSDRVISSEGYYHHKLTLKIYNCIDIKITSILARLVYSLQNEFFVNNRNIEIDILHYIPNFYANNTPSIIEKLKILSQTLPLGAISFNYYQDFSNLSPSVWSSYNDLCLIKYSSLFIANGSSIKAENNKPYTERDKEYQHFLIKFANDKLTNSYKPYICPLGNSLFLYKFFNIDLRNSEKITFINQTATNINEDFYHLLQQFDTMLVTDNYCYDNINPSIFLKLFDRIKDDQGVILYLCKILGFDLDKKNVSKSDVDNEIFSAINIIKERFELKKNAGSISIFSESGLKEFIEDRIISDLRIGYDYPPSLSFTDEELVAILKDTINSIETNSETSNQKFYIIKSSKIRKISLMSMIAKDCGIYFSDSDSYSSNLSNYLYSDIEATNSIYNYWINEIKNRNDEISYNSNNLLMTDKEAIAFINELISEVINRSN